MKHFNACKVHFDSLNLLEQETADPDDDNNVSLPTELQWKRLLKQATTVASLYEKLCERGRLGFVSARAGAGAAGRADLEAMMMATGGMDEARRSFSIDDIAHDVQK